MNLAQMRTMLRSILTAGGGANQGIGTDDFWADKELNTYLNMAQSELYKIIRRARSDYFSRVVRTTDPPFLVRGVLFDPSTLRWQAGQGNYTLPPDGWGILVRYSGHQDAVNQADPRWPAGF